MITKDEFVVLYSVEAFADWMMERGIADGVLSENWSIEIDDIELQKDEYIRVSGDIVRKVDA